MASHYITQWPITKHPTLHDGHITKQTTLNNGLLIHCNVIIKINILPYTMAYITKHPTLHNGLLKTSYITQWPILQNILHYTMAYYKTSYITQWPHDTL